MFILVLLKNLDYESKSSYILKVKASNDMNAISYKEVKLDIVDVNEAPARIGIQHNNIYKDASVGSVAGEIQVHLKFNS